MEVDKGRSEKSILKHRCNIWWFALHWRQPHSSYIFSRRFHKSCPAVDSLRKKIRILFLFLVKCLPLRCLHKKRQQQKWKSNNLAGWSRISFFSGFFCLSWPSEMWRASVKSDFHRRKKKGLCLASERCFQLKLQWRGDLFKLLLMLLQKGPKSVSFDGFMRKKV